MSVLLMAAEDLPSSRQFWVVCGGFISAGRGKHAFLATQSHAQVSTPCDCIVHRQNRELAHVNGNNNITGADLGRGGVVWLRRFLGRGRNGMWLGRLALLSLRTWNQNSSFFFARENSGVQPLLLYVKDRCGMQSDVVSGLNNLGQRL